MGSNIQSVTFGNLCIHSAFGPRFSGEEYASNGNVACLRTTDVKSDGIIDYESMPLAQLELNRFKNHILRRNDIVITRTGAYLGRVAIFDTFRLPVLPGAFSIRFRVDESRANPHFIRYFFGSSEGQTSIQSIAIGSVQPNLNIPNLHSLLIPVPSIEQQNRIVSVLANYDRKIELNRRTNETLEAMAKALFKSWFVDFDPVREKAAGRKPAGLDAATAKLFPSTFEDSPLGPIPKGWRAVPLPQAIAVNPTLPLSKGTVAPYLEMSNMPTTSARAVDWEDREFGSGMRFQNGHTLVARITPCLENGKTAYVDFLSDGQIGWGSTEYIVLRCKPPLPPIYSYFLARSDVFRTHVIQNMTGTSGRQRAPAECLNKYHVVVPDAKIASCFGEFAEHCLRQMKQNDEESRTLAATRDSLLPKLLTGELLT